MSIQQVDIITNAAGTGAPLFSNGLTAPISGSSGNVYSGTYTASGINGTNVSSIGAASSPFFRIGNVVTVKGVATVTFVAGGGASCIFSLSLPVPTVMTGDSQLSGVVVPSSGTNSFYPFQVQSISSNRTIAYFTGNISAAGATNISFAFSYLVLP